RKFRNKVGSGLFSGFTLFTIFTFRFFIEYIKEVQVDFENGMLINMGQILSIPLIIAGGYLIYRSFRWKATK
ncbi:MAG: prolipoprotein diacylglyceryl transferase, partial [Bacteroidaceae bacterium]|nr:prolipoprotein diacylglyceryl transferase [Bacteroidaceae bacterium]